MKHIKLLLTLLIFTISSTAMPFVGSTRECIVLAEFGDNEYGDKTLEQTYTTHFQPEGIGAASDILLTALYQNVPVLAPAKLWNNIVEHKELFDAMATLPIRDLKKKYGRMPLFNSTKAITTFKAQCTYAQTLSNRLSHYLLHSTTKQALQQVLKSDMSSMQQTMPETLRTADWLTWEHLMQYLMCSLVPIEHFTVFNITVKQAPDCPFYLFLPTTVLQEANATPVKDHVKNLTARELYLGLKIDHCTQVQNPLQPQTLTYRDEHRELMPCLFDQLFIHNNEIPKSMRQRWCFYMMGHGLYNQAAKDALKKLQRTESYCKRKLATAKNGAEKQTLTQKLKQCANKIDELRLDNIILGMPLNTTQTVLKFLDKEITTQAFFFTSCSSGGQQAIDTFSDNDGSPLQFSYPVITDTLAEAPLLRAIPHLIIHECCDDVDDECDLSHLIDWDAKSIILDTPYDFELLFKLAHNSMLSKETFDLMLHSFAPTHQCNDTELQTSAVPATIRKNCKRLLTTQCSLHTNNHISIRLPGSTRFSIVGPARIINAAVNSQTIRQSDGLIMLCAPKLNSALNIKRLSKHDACPAIVSGIAGPACHEVKAINAPEFSLSEILESLVSCEELYVPKCIHIKQITCLDDTIDHTSTKPCTIYDVYCCLSVGADKPDQTPVNHIVLTKNKTIYHRCWDFDVPLAETTYNAFNIINDKTALIKNVLQQFSAIENQTHNHSSVINASEIMQHIKSAR